MSFKIGFNFTKKEVEPVKEKAPNESEIDVIVDIIDKLDVPNELFKIVKNSNDYTTAQYHDIDIFRLKYTAGARWIKIFMANPYKKDYIDSPLFVNQINKNELFWKSDINNIDDYIEIINKVVELRNTLDK